MTINETAQAISENALVKLIPAVVSASVTGAGNFVQGLIGSANSGTENRVRNRAYLVCVKL